MEGASVLEAQFQSALARREPATDTAVDLREITERGMIDLRGHVTDRKFMAAAKAVLGFDLPKLPRTSSTWGDIRVFWLSPDQWLVTCPRARAQGLADDLVQEMGAVHSLVVNVSDMRAIIRLEGEHARTVVMKGTSLDLTHGYPAGTVRRMKFAEIAALLHIVEEHVIDIYVFRSYGHYAWDFLLKAARRGSEVKLFQNRA
jgi:sarcosine oxidase subunit gamma